MFALALWQRVPFVVILVLALLGGAWWMQATHTSADTIGLFLGPKVVLLVQVAAVLAPYGAALAGVLGILYLVTHHHARAIGAGLSAVVLVALKVAWVFFGFGDWVMGHLR